MTALLITYDLNKPGQNYDKLYEVVKGLGTSWWHYLDSTWLVATSLTPSQAWERIKPVVDASDNFLVVNISGDSYSGWLPENAWEWIRKYV